MPVRCPANPLYPTKLVLAFLNSRVGPTTHLKFPNRAISNTAPLLWNDMAFEFLRSLEITIAQERPWGGSNPPLLHYKSSALFISLPRSKSANTHQWFFIHQTISSKCAIAFVTLLLEIYKDVLTTCPDINRFSIRILMEDFRGKIARCSCKSWI